MSTDDELVDKEQIDNLKELFSDGFSDFIQTYFNDFETKEKDLVVAINASELDNAKKIAHILKGSSLNIGAIGLAKICSKIEADCKLGKVEEILQGYQGLKETYPKTKEAYLRLSL